MKRKGQAAMEFLMTYGWAILVVLIVIGALAYFGVLNPQQFLPQKCQFSTGLVCVDKQLTSDGAYKFRISNGLGNAIEITDLVVDDTQDFADCTVEIVGDSGTVDDVAAPSGAVLLAGEEKNFLCTFTPPAALDSGQRIKAKMVLSYTDRQTKFDHDVTGTLLIDIEESAAAP